MVSINYAFKEIISKIVYYGPGLSGKTTNLQYVFSKVPKDTRGELISLATDADRTLYFDFLPVNVGTIRGFATKFQLYTVPGQVYYNATRKLVLRGVDGLVFVADSQKEKMDDNIESLKNLEENLAEYGYDINDIPLVIQYNKRDLPNVATVNEMQRLLNPRNVPYFEAIATTGEGVFATLKAISKMVLDKARQTSPEPKPKPRVEPVVVSMDGQSSAEESSPPEMMVANLEPSTSRIQSPSDGYELPTPEMKAGSEPETPIEKPRTLTGVETPTNVVVSSTPDEVSGVPTNDNNKKDELEETTEHSILKEESYVPDIEMPVIKKHPAILDADKISILYKQNQERWESKVADNFDEEATQIADQDQSKVLSKPHMAESVKVKPKKKSGLFGWLKRK
ncbi:MAG: GTPase domain-containing protein [candidate division Zixibacteria bacterium]|nr:GTPase domain-containing protein [candidate division Zixibacteria bacterium]